MQDQNTDIDQGGRPDFEPTATQKTWVTQAADIGLAQEIIVKNVINPDTDLPVTVKTLRKHFRRELDTGLALWGVEIMTVATTIAKDAEHKDCVRMNIWLQQSRLGSKATTVNEIVGADGETMGIPQLVIMPNGNTDAPTENDSQNTTE